MSLARYAILIAPSHNRVYGASAVDLTIAELGVFNAELLAKVLGEISATKLGSVDYVTFAAPRLDARTIALLSNLSSLFALFELDGEKLIPLELSRVARFDSDLVSIQKYSGKTNEHFTKLLLNVTLATCAFASEFPGRKFRVLDPLCGRGTTLNQALTYGFDAAGVELDKKDFEAYAAFIQRYVKDKRLKHTAQLGHVKGERKLDLTLAPDKAAHKAGQTCSVSFVNADTVRAAEVLPPRSFDLIVTDAPYGVHHGSHGEARIARAPGELFERALPVWFELLRPGGALGIAWNTRVLRREALAQLLVQHGFQAKTAAPYSSFEHEVDHAIVRDVMVATKAA